MSQAVITCDPDHLSIDISGYPSCLDGGSSAWQSVPVEEMTSIWQPLPVADATLITAAILGLWVTAFGFKFVYNQIMSGRPGRY